jgi:hypothetical protein
LVITLLVFSRGMLFSSKKNRTSTFSHTYLLQNGSNFVERQMVALEAAFQDPLATATRSLHYDGLPT